MTSPDIKSKRNSCLEVYAVVFASAAFLCIVLFPMPAFADSNLGVLNFKQIVTDKDGQKYLIGEVQNNDPDNNIESTVIVDSFQQFQVNKYIGLVGHGMAMPFKIKLPDNFQANLTNVFVDSQKTLAQSNDLLKVDYSTLQMDKKTHAISGVLRNTSTTTAYGIIVYAIAMNMHAKVLDVTQSNAIHSILPNGSAPFTLTPMASIASDVGYYSCFVPGQSGQNYTLAAENGQSITFEIGSDGEIKKVQYDPVSHAISFSAEGVFPQGGWAELVIKGFPDSYSNYSSLSVTLNGRNDTKSISDMETMGGQEYKHVSFLFPFGKNIVTIQPASPVPEFPLPSLIMILTFLMAIVFFSFKGKGQLTTS